MPLGELQFETTDDAAKVHGAVLETLVRRHYDVRQDSNTKIVAKYKMSSFGFGHDVEVNLDSGHTGNTIITLIIDHRNSAAYLRLFNKELIKSLPNIQKKVKPSTVPLSPEVNKAILWQKDEALVNYIAAQEFIEDKTKTLGARVGHKGFLIVTNQRVIFACKLGFLAKDYGVTYGISLEDVMSISPGKFGFNDKLVILEKSGQHKDFIKPMINDLIPMIKATISERRSQLEARKDKERIQVVLDFSSLKDVLARGGVVMSSYNCPKCNAMIEIPEAGKVMICKYCGAPVKPVDIFDRIKSLL